MNENNTGISRRGFLLSSVAAAAASRISFGAAGPGTTYYVDSGRGSDGNPGTSSGKAWKTLAKVNETLFKPGDRILLASNSRFTGQLMPKGSGALDNGRPLPFVIDAYGKGAKPLIDAEGRAEATLYLHNVEYWEVSNLEILNKGVDRKPRRAGVYVHLEDFGTASHIYIRDLYVHDVNGSLVKRQGGGAGISWRNGGRSKKSRFDDLLIEGCRVQRCERNGIMGWGYTNREEWFPSLNVVVRNNLLEEVPGDGIVPIGCDGVLVEHNTMRNCPRMLPDSEAAAGMWPWGCDNAILQFNEVSDHKAPWDAQGFDSDWDCRNTVIQYNYSHDNDGGFLLVCNNGGAPADRAINIDTIVRYNFCVNDGIRPAPAARFKKEQQYFTPTFHISGPVKNTRIYNNILYVPEKPTPAIDRTMIKMDNWGGPWPVDTYFANNIFYVEGRTRYIWGGSTGNRFAHNLYYGTQEDAPEDRWAIHGDPLFVSAKSAAAGFETLKGFMLKKGSPCIGAAGPVANNGGRDFFGRPVGVTGPHNVGVSEQPE